MQTGAEASQGPAVEEESLEAPTKRARVSGDVVVNESDAVPKPDDDHAPFHTSDQAGDSTQFRSSSRPPYILTILSVTPIASANLIMLIAFVGAGIVGKPSHPHKPESDESHRPCFFLA